jgi:hypothetical protein
MTRREEIMDGLTQARKKGKKKHHPYVPALTNPMAPIKPTFPGPGMKASPTARGRTMGGGGGRGGGTVRGLHPLPHLGGRKKKQKGGYTSPESVVYPPGCYPGPHGRECDV